MSEMSDDEKWLLATIAKLLEMRPPAVVQNEKDWRRGVYESINVLIHATQVSPELKSFLTAVYVHTN